MSGGGPVTSLLPDNPGAQFEAVQGGGGYVPESKKVSGWHSTPLLIPVASDSTSLNSPTNASHSAIKNYKDMWRRTLGPSVPSRHKPRADPHIVIGSIDIVTCPTYIVAPLRGDLDAAKDIIFWAHELLNSNSNAHVVFIGPITEGGSRADGDMIEKMLESLMASNPGHVVCVGTNSLTAGSVDGLVLHAMPHSSKQVVFGYLPDPDDIYSRSSRMIDCLELETVRIPIDAKTRHHEGERMLYIHFNKATAIYNRDKQPKPQIIRSTHDWKAPPGWVTQIQFQKKGGEPIQSGGKVQFKDDSEILEYNNEKIGINATKKGLVKTKLINGPTPVVSLPESTQALSTPIFDISKIRKPEDAFEKWEKGEFTDGELVELEKHGLKFSNEIYAAFFKGLHECKGEGETTMSPECAVFRYIMAHNFLYNTQKKNSVISSGSDDSSDTGVPVPAPSPAAVPAAVPKPAPKPVAVPVPITSIPAPEPSAPAPEPSTLAPSAPEPSAPTAEPSANTLKITLTKKDDPNSKFEYIYDNTSDVIIFGKNPDANYEKSSKKLILPENAVRIKIGLKGTDSISNSHFAIKKFSDTEWYIVDLKSSLGIEAKGSKLVPIDSWTDNQIKRTKIYDEDTFTLAPTFKPTEGIVTPNIDAIIVKISLPGVKRAVKSGDTRAASVAAARATEATKPAPVPAPAPLPAPAPVVAPAPLLAPEPVVAPAPLLAPEPVTAPAPLLAPEPVTAPEPVIDSGISKSRQSQVLAARAAESTAPKNTTRNNKSQSIINEIKLISKDKEKLNKKNVPDLQKYLKSIGKPTNGKKGELIERIMASP